jgi:septal ring factor EnvC (AmiA/AmiB activator)
MIKTKRELKESEHKNRAIEIQLQNTERTLDDIQMTNSKLSKDLEKFKEQKENLENINSGYRNEIEN